MSPGEAGPEYCLDHKGGFVFRASKPLLEVLFASTQFLHQGTLYFSDGIAHLRTCGECDDRQVEQEHT